MTQMLHSFRVIILAINVVKGGTQWSDFGKVLERLDIFQLKESEIYRWLYLLFIKTFIGCLLCVRPLTWLLEDIIES